MAKLRDWWPSEDRPLPAAAEKAKKQRSSSPPAIAIAAFHKDLPAAASAASSASSASSASASSLLLPRPVIKLCDSQEHKQELMRKLLGRSCSTPDLPSSFCSAIAIAPAQPTSASAKPCPSSGGDSSSSSGQQKQDPEEADPKKQHRHRHSHSHRHRQNLQTNQRQGLKRGRQDEAMSTAAPPSSASAAAPAAAISSPTIATAPSTPTTPATASCARENPLMSRREIHIYSERQRRKGMTHLYSLLHSLLPHANPKTDRCTVLTEAMEYIYELQARVEELGKEKSKAMMALGVGAGEDGAGGGGLGLGLGLGLGNAGSGSASGPSPVMSAEAREQLLAAADVVVRFCGADDAFITLNSPRPCNNSGVWSSILHVLHEHELELLNVTLSTSADVDYHCIHAKISNASEVKSNELQKMLQEVVLEHAAVLRDSVNEGK